MATTQRHGKLFSRGERGGGLIVHVQRENGLAHRTFILRGWQLWLVRALSRRWVQVLVGGALLLSAALATQAARVPMLTRRIAHLEEDQRRLDTLEQHLTTLQARYDQVQKLMSTTTGSPGSPATPPRAPQDARPGAPSGAPSGVPSSAARPTP